LAATHRHANSFAPVAVNFTRVPLSIRFDLFDMAPLLPLAGNDFR
jgi:hypothetical protein